MLDNFTRTFNTNDSTHTSLSSPSSVSLSVTTITNPVVSVVFSDTGYFRRDPPEGLRSRYRPKTYKENPHKEDRKASQTLDEL